MRQARVLNPTATFKNPSREGGPWVQVSRVGMVLVNELVIGIKDKDKFNGSEPKDDGQFADYVTNPSLPTLVEVVYGATGMLAPTTYPRADLVAAFLNGVPTVNKMSDTLFEAVRLNTAVPPTAPASQNSLGAATCFDPPADAAHGPTLNLARTGCDPAGFPNGRRPGDDTVDIVLRVAMGFLLDANHAPIRAAPLVDGAAVTRGELQQRVPVPQVADAGVAVKIAIIFALALALAAAACGDDSPNVPSDSPTTPPGDGSGSGSGSDNPTLTSYVIDLVMNHTAATETAHAYTRVQHAARSRRHGEQRVRVLVAVLVAT